MNSLKNNVVVSVSLLLFLSKTACAGLVTVHNNTDENICFTYIKTKASLKSKIGLDKDKHQLMYDGDAQGHEQALPIGTSAKLNGYKSNSDYDRVLWVVPQSSCGVFMDLAVGSQKPEKATPLEVGSKTNVVIVSDGPGKFKLKSWTKSLEEELDRRRRAMYEALGSQKLKWDDLMNASPDRFDKVAKAFKGFHDKLKSSEKTQALWRRTFNDLFDQFNASLDRININNKTALNVLAKKIELAASKVFQKMKDEASKIDMSKAAQIKIPLFIRNLKIADVTRAYEQLNEILGFDPNAKRNMEILTTAYETVKKVYNMLNPQPE